MAAFPTTPRSLLKELRSKNPARKAAARSALAEQYWQPIYAYVRWRWRLEPDAAADLAQELFVRDLERDIFERFDPDRARFRNFLRICSDNLVRDGARRQAASKRGGPAVSLADLEREVAALEPELTPEEAFDRAWRRRVVALARARLDAKLRERGRAQHAAVFALAHDEDPPPSYAEIAARVGTSVTNVTNWLHSTRREFRAQVSVVLREGGASETELAEELARLK